MAAPQVLRGFKEVWLADFEFCQPDGENPTPACLVARELFSHRLLRLGPAELASCNAAPFDTSPDRLFVAYYAPAELGCFLALRWPLPSRVLDLFAEFRCLTNGRPIPCGNGLLGALAFFGLAGIAPAEKQEMRELAMRGGSYSPDEMAALLDYCQTDVDALAELLPAMAGQLDLPRALLRGRYMAAVARMETAGIPIDVATLDSIRAHWGQIKAGLIDRVDREFGVFDGASFRQEKFARWLAVRNIAWPQTDTGQLSLADDTFRTMVKTHPELAPLRELRHTLGEMRLESLAVGSDGRNRCMLSPFRSKTGRNQPSNTRFAFGPSCWLRGLIKPAEGRAIAYVDWSQQEFGIAAALSGDEAMRAAYQSSDPYLAFAKQARAVPTGATKQSHLAERERFKACTLAVQYGMGPESLARSIGQQTAEGRSLLALHRRTFPDYWRWSDAAVDHALCLGWLQTVFGWRLHVAGRPNARSIANFPMQANGAEMLRLACCLATERGLTVCAPVHDALLVEGPADGIGHTIAATQDAMREASRIVLDGFELRTDADVVTYPRRYMDKRGRAMWETVLGLLPADAT